MRKTFINDFIFCGLSGWCMECFWTGLHAIFKKTDRTLSCKTSIWMFPIYGMAAFIMPISKILKNNCAFVRGGIYTIIIFATEWMTGKLLKKYKACPWDYSKSKLNYQGLIRLDYAPVWFIVGLFYEKLLSGKPSS